VASRRLQIRYIYIYIHTSQVSTGNLITHPILKAATVTVPAAATRLLIPARTLLANTRMFHDAPVHPCLCFRPVSHFPTSFIQPLAYTNIKKHLKCTFPGIFQTKLLQISNDCSTTYICVYKQFN